MTPSLQKTPVSLLSATLLLIILIQLPPQTATAQNQPSIEEIDEIFSGWDSETTPGCAAGVTRGGETVFSRAWGMADLENPVRNTPSTIFEAGSVSKQFTAAAVILLQKEGKLSLEDDIRSHVPELPNYGEVITLRHLLNHTSGLRDWGSVTAISGWGRQNRTHNHDHVLDILSRQNELNFLPGERYSYSNSGYNLLAIVVERVSGVSFADYSQKIIFEPLGMANTEWRDDYTRIVPGRSSAYTGTEDSERFTINRPIEHVHGNGGLLTTTGDLLIWSSALSSRYFGDEFHDELITQGVLRSGRTISYASGVQINSDHGEDQIVHTGATSGYRAYLSIYPESDLSVALLCNVTGANPGSLGSTLSGLFLDGEDEDRPEPESAEVAAERLEELTGIWADPRNHRPLELRVEDDTLRTSGGSRLVPKSDRDFRAGSSNTVYRFIEDDDGGRPLITVIREGYSEEILMPVGEYTDEAPEQFAGTFESSDAETVIEIGADNGKLIAHRRPGDTFELEPIYEDTYTASGFGLIRFHRNASSEVIRFSYSSGRVYDMRFLRVE
ncbi:MAG: beta-lactamase family protein [Balneolaceae bacterium]|nr:beta-lactamase family protein [Balneolaceae bacterium]MCH8548546.1 beta-lactamase family protein [Balneolaceae bacterium]